MYITQSCLHAFTAAVLSEGSIRAWAIQEPVAKQRLRLLVVIFPALSPPLYQVLNPQRGSASFRVETALLDSSLWLAMEPLAWLLLALLAATSVVFVLQELLPVLRHTFGDRGGSLPQDAPEAELAAQALRPLGQERPRVLLLEDEEEPVLLSSQGNGCIYVSRALLRLLEPQELAAALAHEAAHLRRTSRAILILGFLFRVVMFFNPVVLLAFRKAVQEEEKICDDMAVQMTGSAAALAGALTKLMPARQSENPWAALQQESHRLQLQARVRRLQAPPANPRAHGWPELAATVAAVAAINYFVV
jgi:beta-lactamase regulating signal transducer with metallopeptidase domain